MTPPPADLAAAIGLQVAAQAAKDESGEDAKLHLVLWRESAEYKKITAWRIPVFAFGFIVLIGGCAASLLGREWIVAQREPIEVEVIAAVLLGGIACLPVVLYRSAYTSARAIFMDRVQVGAVARLQEEERQLVLDANGKPDFASLWSLTQKRIDLYHSIATEQAEKSYKMGRRATVGGFVAVLILGGLTAFANGGTASIAASVVGVAGAAMTGYIGATFMKSQSEASAQLSQFFLQPVEFSRMLGVERLLDSLEPADRARAIQRIVDSTMPAAVLTPSSPKGPGVPAKKSSGIDSSGSLLLHYLQPSQQHRRSLSDPPNSERSAGDGATRG